MACGDRPLRPGSSGRLRRKVIEPIRRASGRTSPGGSRSLDSIGQLRAWSLRPPDRATGRSRDRHSRRLARLGPIGTYPCVRASVLTRICWRWGSVPHPVSLAHVLMRKAAMMAHDHNVHLGPDLEAA